jgi:hypothetical protein
LENIHPGGERNISQCHLGENYEKGKSKKGENVKEKRGKKKEEKRRKRENGK